VKTSLVILGVLTVFAPFGITAEAQTYDALPTAVPDGIPGLPPFEILGIIRSSGLRPLSPPVRRGRFYVVRAMAPGGADVRVLVDAGSGRIFSVARIDDAPPGAASAYGPEPGYAPAPWYRRPGPYYYYGPQGYYAPQGRLANESVPEPSTNPAPATRVNPPVTHSADLTPRTPLPRPRPPDAQMPPSQTALSTAKVGASLQNGDQGSSGTDKVGEDKPLEAPAAKPATTLPPVTPLD
jgi:hypothetical protein